VTLFEALARALQIGGIEKKTFESGEGVERISMEEQKRIYETNHDKISER
jgi:hypothetical protein